VSAPGDGPLIHVGYHKTGTSWLQRQLFRDAAAGFWWGGKAEDSPVNRLIAVSPLEWDERRARDDFAAEAAKAGARALCHVVSLERLAGHPFSGGYDSAELARRLRATFPRGRVLVVIREQRAMVASTYKQYVKAGGAAPLRLFLEPPVYRRPRTAAFDLRHYEYHWLLALYLHLFGAERVLALPYEQLREDPRTFAATVARFAGAEPSPEALERLDPRALNVARRASSTAAGRVVNRMFVRADVNPQPLVASERLARAATGLVRAGERAVPASLDRLLERRMHATIAEVVGDRYRDSNRACAALTGIDLAAYGYDGGGSVGAEHEARALA
jgi:Sulfotransferase domain